MLETPDVANDMKNLLISNPNVAEPDTTKPDVKPNVSATSSGENNVGMTEIKTKRIARRKNTGSSKSLSPPTVHSKQNEQ